MELVKVKVPNGDDTLSRRLQIENDNGEHSQHMVVVVEEKVPDDTLSRRMQIKNDNGEHSLNMVVVVEDLRVGLYIAFLVVSMVGAMLTSAFTEGDKDRYLIQVYGLSNLCSVYDFAPSTYVLPTLWCFGIFFGNMYSITSIFRTQVSYLEKKLSRCASLLLTIVFVYVALSLIFFSTIFAVQPDPEEPVTIVIHTIPYINLKLMFGVLQVAIVYFGIKVSWVGLNFPRWFYIGSIIHVIALNVVNIIATLWLVNGLGNMGANMEGKGLWWSVRSEESKLAGNILGNYLGMLLGIILPLIQALYICRTGTNSHALIIAVSDNRVSAYKVDKKNEDQPLNTWSAKPTDL